jgi:drug/metabolite transporter (DMT)-like permease
METTSNIKDKLSTFCGILAAICGALLVAGESGVVLPGWLKATAGAVSAVCLAVIGYLTGKTPAAKPKSINQVIDQNVPNP